MQLTHIALWTNHLERLRDFYVKYFNGKSNEKYVNPKKGFGLLYRYGTKFRCRRDRGSQGGGWQGGDHEPCRGGYLPSARNRPETITACI